MTGWGARESPLLAYLSSSPAYQKTLTKARGGPLNSPSVAVNTDYRPEVKYM